MDWVIQLQIMVSYFLKEYGIRVLIIEDGRCRGGVRLLFEDNRVTDDDDRIISLVSGEMMKHPLVRYTIDQNKFRARRGVMYRQAGGQAR